MKQFFASIALLCYFSLFTACGGDSGENETTSIALLSSSVTLPSTPVILTKKLDEIPINKDKTLSLSVAFGSGIFHVPEDPVNIFYTTTDRGPIVPCADSKKILGKKKLCKHNGNVDKEGKVFLLPNYSPTIYKIRLNHDNATNITNVAILDTIPLTNGEQGISGLINPLKSAKKEKAYNLKGKRLSNDPSGLDIEAITRLNNGDFWLADEYASGLVHVNAAGKILSREVPQSIGDDIDKATYPVLESLPKIIRMRSVNRGIEALGVSPDQGLLYFMMQSPLANPNKKAFKESRNVRIFSGVLSSNGRFGGVNGEFVYTLDEPNDFVFNEMLPEQNKIFISDMAVLDNGILLVVERTRKVTKIYKVLIDSASNILAGTFDDKDTSPSLEQIADLDSVGVIPVRKQLIYSSLTSIANLDPLVEFGKIEGITVLDKTHLLLINDNDYGVSDDVTRLQVIELEQDLL